MPPPLKVLIVEDNPADAELVVLELECAGFKPNWRRVDTEPAFLDQLDSELDLILSDYQMPAFNGLRALELLKQKGLEIPFILVSGTIGEDLAVEAMKNGATDYLLKDRLVRLGPTVLHALAEFQLRRDRRQAEEVVQRQQAQLRVLFDLIPAMIWFKDTENRILRVNQRAAETAGMSVAQIEGKPSREIYPAEAARFYADDLKVIHSGVPKLAIVETIQDREGKDFWVQTDKVPVCDKDGKVVGIVVMAQDITERKQAEKTLQLLNSAVLQSKESILITDAQFDFPGPRILFVNPAFTTITGYTAEEVIGKTPRILQGPHTDGNVLKRLRKNLESGESFEGETINYRKDGTEFHLEWQIAPIRNAAGETTHFVAIQRDITGRYQAEIDANRLAAIVESSDDAIIGEGLNGVISTWNKGAQKIFGYTALEMIGASNVELMPSDRLKEESKILEEIKHGKSVEHFETLRRTKDGRVIDISVTVSPIQDATGGLIGVAKVARDITERKQAEETLRDSEERFAGAFEHAPIGVALVSVEGRWLKVNRALCELMGYSEDKLLAVTFADVTHPDDIATSRENVRRIAAGEIHSYSVEKRYLHGLGHTITASLNVSLVRDQQGQPKYLIAQIQDITAWKRTVESLRASEATMAAAQRIGHFGSWEMDLTNPDGDASALRWSDEMFRIAGFAPGAVKVSNELFFGLVPLEDHEPIRQAIASAVRERQTYSIVHRLIRPDGKERIIKETAEVFINEKSGQPAKIVGTAHDITERKQLEEQIRLSQKMDAIGTLAGGIAHDFNNILTGISGYTELAKMAAKGNPVVSEYLDTVLLTAGRASHLVRQILTFSRQEPLERTPIQLLPVVKETFNLLRATIPSTIEFDLSLANDAPTVFADATQIHQILMNLGTNAWHAMKDRAGRLQVKLEKFVVDARLAAETPRLHPGVYARVSVRDTGSGMDQATLQRIFEPFFTTKSIGEGTGLGLAVVHGIIDNHDGAITVESQLGEGTTFRVYLPAYAGDAALTRTEAGATPRGHGERILVVDDEELLARLGQKTLIALGYKVEFATKPSVVLAMVRSEPERFSLVVTDQTMPGITGLALATQLREIRADLPVILMTGYAAAVTPEQIKVAGIRVLLKPATIHSLGTAVRAALASPLTATLSLVGHH